MRAPPAWIFTVVEEETTNRGVIDHGRCAMRFNCPGFMSDFDPGAMFLRILVPVDFGPESRRALGLACVLRQNFGSEIHVFHLTAFGMNDEYIRSLGQPWAEAD